MAVRVDRIVFDPASGGQPGGVQIEDDGTRMAPWQPRPFTTKTEYQVSEAMRLMAVPAEVIRQQLPPVPYQLFPPVVGYDDTPLTVQEVLQTDRWTPQRRSWISGTPRYPRRVDVMEDMWSGTLRGFNASPNVAG
jgi:hypothetical protein